MGRIINKKIVWTLTILLVVSLLSVVVFARPPTQTCCQGTNDCVYSGQCTASGTATWDVDGDGDKDYCLNREWWDCNTASQCGGTDICVNKNCVAGCTASNCGSALCQSQNACNAALPSPGCNWNNNHCCTNGYFWHIASSSCRFVDPCNPTCPASIPFCVNSGMACCLQGSYRFVEAISFY